MKSVSTSPTDSMPNTDITYFHSEQDSLSILPLHQTETDTFEIYMPAGRFLPSTQLEHNKDLFGNVLFTVGFLIIFAFVRLRGKDLFYNLLNTLLKRKKAEIILNEGILMFVLLHHFYRYRLYHRRKFYQFIYIISFHRLISLSFSSSLDCPVIRMDF